MDCYTKVYMDEALRVIREVHEGICGSHRSRQKIKWLIHRHDYFLPNISINCVKYAKGCEE